MALFPEDPDMLGDDIDRVGAIFADAEETTRLSQWEEEFIDSLRERVLQYGRRTMISDKQWEILERIEDKLCA